MVHLPLGFGDLDFSDWIRGLLSAFISGGAAAVTSGITVNLMDADHYNVHTGKFYILVGAMFATNGVMNMMNFLRTKPLPEYRVVTTTVVTKTKVPDTTTTVEEVHKEPIAPQV